MPRLLAFALLASTAACYGKPDLPSHDACDSAEACTSSGGVSESSSSDDGPVVTTSATSSSTTSSTTDPADADESSSSSDASDEGSSSTGEPADNLYAPCTSDEMCRSGYCVHGFCSQVCWSQNGETPCPPSPDDALGVTIVCGTIGFASGGLCEGCQDCTQYCIASCTAGSTCPNGGYCVSDDCAPAPDYGYCGS